jgi:hypothetical protein
MRVKPLQLICMVFMDRAFELCTNNADQKDHQRIKAYVL